MVRLRQAIKSAGGNLQVRSFADVLVEASISSSLPRRSAESWPPWLLQIEHGFYCSTLDLRVGFAWIPLPWYWFCRCGTAYTVRSTTDFDKMGLTWRHRRPCFELSDRDGGLYLESAITSNFELHFQLQPLLRVNTPSSTRYPFVLLIANITPYSFRYK